LKLASFVHIEFPGLLQHASAWFRAHYRPLFSAAKALLSPTSLTPLNEAAIIRLREDWRWQRGSGEFSIALFLAEDEQQTAIRPIENIGVARAK
jgi:hypothetical protein